jgi:hypothetical protein
MEEPSIRISTSSRDNSKERTAEDEIHNVDETMLLITVILHNTERINP